MTDPHERSNRDRRSQERKVWRAAFLVSVVAHLALFVFLWQTEPEPVSPFAATGPEQRDHDPAAGSLRAMAMRQAPEQPSIPDPVPVPVPDLVEPPELEPEPEIEETSLDEAFEGLAERPGDDELGREDVGVEGASGRGDGGTADEGLRRVVPPSPRGMIMPPSNRDLRGTEVEVWVFVDEEGKVVADSTRLEPPTRDRRFNERLKREAAQWVFQPARQGGEPVAAWFPYTIGM